MSPLHLLALVVLPTLAAAQSALAAPQAQCRGLGTPAKVRSFPPGERLDYTLDAMGAEAGKLSIRVLPERNQSLPIEVTASTNTFFSKVRKVKASAVSHLNPRTLRPHRYTEDAMEDNVHRTAEVSFLRDRRIAQLNFKNGQRQGQRNLTFGAEGLDPVGAVFLIRQLPLEEGMSLCFDAYALRTMWRVTGKVVGKERVSLKVGDFEAWHLAGEAVAVNNPRWKREVHLWVSTDERRLPLASVGVIDVGAVRATLSGYSRPDGSSRAEGGETLKW